MRLGRTVEELLATISAAELAEWVAFDRIDPIGDWRGDAQAAQVATQLANVHRGKRKPYAIKDFLMTWEPKRQQTMQEMIDIAKATTLAMGGEVK